MNRQYFPRTWDSTDPKEFAANQAKWFYRASELGWYFQDYQEHELFNLFSMVLNFILMQYKKILITGAVIFAILFIMQSMPYLSQDSIL